jgi:hypothetical protein
MSFSGIRTGGKCQVVQELVGFGVVRWLIVRHGALA